METGVFADATDVGISNVTGFDVLSEIPVDNEIDGVGVTEVEASKVKPGDPELIVMELTDTFPPEISSIRTSFDGYVAEAGKISVSPDPGNKFPDQFDKLLKFPFPPAPVQVRIADGVTRSSSRSIPDDRNLNARRLAWIDRTPSYRFSRPSPACRLLIVVSLSG